MTKRFDGRKATIAIICPDCDREISQTEFNEFQEKEVFPIKENKVLLAENKKLREQLEEIKNNYQLGQQESHKLGWRQGIEHFKEKQLVVLLAEFFTFGSYNWKKGTNKEELAKQFLLHRANSEVSEKGFLKHQAKNSECSLKSSQEVKTK